MNPDNPTFRGPRWRAERYNEAHPNYPPLGEANGMVGGCWMIGACYKNDNKLYGAYPRGYLERVHSMFPDAERVLHVYSGGLTEDAALDALRAGRGGKLGGPSPVTLVDMHGPEQARFPTWQGDLFDFCNLYERAEAQKYDLILADPPYSADDAVKYECPPPSRPATLRALRKVCKRGGHLVWLDQQWPMHRKAQWRTWGTVGLIRSTNHRARVVSFFEAQ